MILHWSYGTYTFPHQYIVGTDTVWIYHTLAGTFGQSSSPVSAAATATISAFQIDSPRVFLMAPPFIASATAIGTQVGQFSYLNVYNITPVSSIANAVASAPSVLVFVSPNSAAANAVGVVPTITGQLSFSVLSAIASAFVLSVGSNDQSSLTVAAIANAVGVNPGTSGLYLYLASGVQASSQIGLIAFTQYGSYNSSVASGIIPVFGTVYDVFYVAVAASAIAIGGVVAVGGTTATTIIIQIDVQYNRVLDILINA